MNIQNSPVAQFRSNVQWFLEGNTPQHQTEMVVELLTQLTILVASLKMKPVSLTTEARNFVDFVSEMTRRGLQDTANLKKVVMHLKSLSSNSDISLQNF